MIMIFKIIILLGCIGIISLVMLRFILIGGSNIGSKLVYKVGSKHMVITKSLHNILLLICMLVFGVLALALIVGGE